MLITNGSRRSEFDVRSHASSAAVIDDPKARSSLTSCTCTRIPLMVQSLERDAQGLPPPRPGGFLSPESIDGVPIMLSSACVQIDLVDAQEALSLPEIADGPEEQDHRKGKVGLEKILRGGQVAGKGRGDCDEELSREGDEDEEEAEPRAVHAADGLEGDFIERAAGGSPRVAEPDVGLWGMSVWGVWKATQGPNLRRRSSPR
jgi:hypothetical protein